MFNKKYFILSGTITAIFLILVIVSVKIGHSDTQIKSEITTGEAFIVKSDGVLSFDKEYEKCGRMITVPFDYPDSGDNLVVVETYGRNYDGVILDGKLKYIGNPPIGVDTISNVYLQKIDNIDITFDNLHKDNENRYYLINNSDEVRDVRLFEHDPYVDPIDFKMTYDKENNEIRVYIEKGNWENAVLRIYRSENFEI